MAIKERKQITGTEAQIKGYAGHNGVLAYATDTKHLHVLSGTAGTTTKLANVSDIPAPVDISGKADKTYVDTELDKKANVSHTHTTDQIAGLQDELNGKLATTDKIHYSQITDAPSIPDISGLIPKTGNRGSLAGYEMVNVESTSAVSVTKDTPDIFLTSGAITAPSFKDADECWTKVGALLSTNPSITLKNGWVWLRDTGPVLHQYDLVVFNKTRGLGTATLIVRK